MEPSQIRLSSRERIQCLGKSGLGIDLFLVLLEKLLQTWGFQVLPSEPEVYKLALPDHTEGSFSVNPTKPRGGNVVPAHLGLVDPLF